jgi:hypothetical protein
MIVRIFQILTVVFGGIAAYFWWSNNFDYAFAGVVLAICSFFLSIRFPMKTKNQAIAEQRAAKAEAFDDPE